MVRKPEGRGLYQKPKEQQEQCPAAQGQFNKRRNYSQRVVFLRNREWTPISNNCSSRTVCVLPGRNTLPQLERAGEKEKKNDIRKTLNRY